MSGLNRCEFIGHLGRDPEVRTTQAGAKVVNLSIAITETWKDRNTGERKERTTWVPIVIWNEGLAGVAERFLRKGSRVYVAGQFQVRKWTDQSGQERYSTEIVLQGPRSEIIMLDSKRDGGAEDSPRPVAATGRQPRGQDFDDLDSEIPF